MVLLVIATKRQAMAVEVVARAGRILPALFLPSGLYYIHEGGGLYMIGMSFPDNLVGREDFSWGR
jgi:hypothetical protein